MKVLIIDGESGVRRTLSMILGDEGYEVVVAADGREGLERALAEDPGLVLLDSQAPTLGGLEFLAEYRNSSGKARHSEAG